MGNKLKALRRAARKAGAAKGIYKRAGAKLRMARSLPNRGLAPPYKRYGPPPPGVKKLPSGRYPPNYRWAGHLYRGKQWTAALARKYPDGVRFTRDGYPNFTPYAIKTITFKKGFKDRAGDIAFANSKFDAPPGYTWHHHQDGRRLQLVPTDLHNAIRHGGGIANLGR
jgi:hypothetical protein